jgi:putative membrane protein
VLFVAALALGLDELRRNPLGLAGAVGLFVLVLALAAGWQWLAWTRYSFWFDADGDLRVRSGVLQVKERRVQVSRLQSVDVTQPLLARVFGLAEIRPEVAGSSSGATRVGYLLLDDAQRLRAELLARAAGIRVAADEAAPEAPETVLVTVPAGVLLTSLVLQPETLVLGIGLPVLAVLMFVFGAYEALLPLVLLFFTPFVVVGRQFLTWFGFTVAESPDGLRLRFGLTSHRSQTVPPGRVQAVRLQRPVLWRSRGWVRVTVNVAGASAGDDAQNRPSTLLPVAPEPVARAVLARVLPGVDPLAVPLLSAPRRSRWRAPLQWRRLAVGADDRVLVARHGWLVPSWDVVPHARTQSVRVTQGPWQRRLRLASVHVDSTPGPVSIVGHHLDAAQARAVADEQAIRAGRGRADDRTIRWADPGSD